MGYLQDFQTQIAQHNYAGYLRLWEEYCAGDEVDGEELKQILQAVKASEMSEPFGRHVDKILPLWEKLGQTALSGTILALILDIQTTNTQTLWDLANNYLKNKYANHPHFQEIFRLVGLRNKENFRGAISNFELLNHLKKGNFVFHAGGWGVGEVCDVSLVREQVNIEFDYVPGRKDLSFANAFKTLTPIANDHFLALRFGNPDKLEQLAKDNPTEVIRMLLRDLGPKTAGEIKDELCELIIPSSEWTRWWQATRSKIKKDTFIETPEELRDPFLLRVNALTHEERLKQAIEEKPGADLLIQLVYSFLKDFSDTLKDPEFKTYLFSKLTDALSFQEISNAQELQIHFLLQDLGSSKEYPAIPELVKRFKSVEDVVQAIAIIAFKKRTLVEVAKARPDWQAIFLNLLFCLDQSSLRDYLLSELLSVKANGDLQKRLEELLSHPSKHPEAFIWYFQKVMHDPKIPFASQEGRESFFESLLILLSHLEGSGEHKELLKKIHKLLSDDRYAIVRQILQNSSIETCQEFLLLSTKCHSLSDHDIKILHSLAEVVHPSLNKKRKWDATEEPSFIWTTQEGYEQLQRQIQQIATVDTVANAKEIEVARSHGDLRENAEFKAALEKRDRLQAELKFLSDQIGKCRILNKEDISTDSVSVGTIVDCTNGQGQKTSYTLLGPWEADPEKNILSFQSKLAQAMKGLKVGSPFTFQGEQYKITGIRSFFTA